jgi:hypothetical protein
MATKKSTPGTRSHRNLQSASTAGVQFETLRDHIEIQRSRLMDAEAVLDCMLRSIDDDVCLDAPGPSYPSVVRIVRDLIHSAIDQLDSVSTKALITRDVSAKTLGEGKCGGVREVATSYVH